MTPLDTAATFSEKTASRLVAERLRSGPPSRLADLFAIVAGHLHDAIREARPTAGDWRLAVEFLTEIGHACDEKRQEWVLLFDLLGASSLVEEINAQRPEAATPNTLRGPFYRPDSPRLESGADICLDGKGEPLAVEGRVVDLDGNGVAGAAVETWQANGLGFYENQQPDLQPEFNLRGLFLTDADGRFRFRTVKPAGYAVPDDGPVGRVLGRIGYPLRRPAHLHFMISAPGFDTVVTHVYDRCDPSIGADPLYGVKPQLLADFRPLPGRKGAPAWALDYRFVMVRSRRPRGAP